MPDPSFYLEVGQRTAEYAADYPSPTIPLLFARDSFYPTIERTLLLQEIEEVGDINLPTWSIGCGRRRDCTPSGFLASFYDMISGDTFRVPLNRMTLSCGVFDLSSGGLSPRRAFLLSADDPQTETLSFSSGQTFTDSLFDQTIRRAYSAWDLLTCFDPVFLPLDTGGVILRNLDPVSTAPGVADEAYAVISGTSISDDDEILPAYAVKDSPTGLDLSSARLTAGGIVAPFLV